MINREKVIKGIEHCTSHDDGRDKFGGVGKCGGCPYYGCDCTDRMKKDALVLLKEQEPHMPNGQSCESVYRVMEIYIGYCPRCGKKINSEDNRKACGHCGQAVKWNDGT